MSTPPNFQTPLNEERGLKRNREEAITSGRATIQTYAETSSQKEEVKPCLGARIHRRDNRSHQHKERKK